MYDIGCGDGRVLIEMASRSIPYTNEEYDSAQHCEDDQTKSNENNNTEATSSIQQSSPSSSSPVAATTTSTSQQHYCTKFIGIDISPERVTEARNNIQKARTSAHIPPHVSIEIICGNALDTDNVDIDYTDATMIFLYLVPRGLRLIKPLVWPKDDEEEEIGGEVDEDKGRVNDDDMVGGLAVKNEEEGGQTTPQLLATTTQQKVHKNQSIKRRRRRTIITYMSPFEDETYVRKELCRVEHQDGAAWPVYLYHTSC